MLLSGFKKPGFFLKKAQPTVLFYKNPGFFQKDLGFLKIPT